MGYLTAALGALAAAAPYFLPMIPAPFGPAVTVVIALASNLYHLYQPSPSASASH